MSQFMSQVGQAPPNPPALVPVHGSVCAPIRIRMRLCLAAAPASLIFSRMVFNPDDLPPAARRKKKVDYEALHSPLNRIPGMDLASVRDLLDLGYSQIDELRGRSPEALFEDVQNLRENTPADRLAVFRMAVYYAETPEPDPRLLQPWRWN